MQMNMTFQLKNLTSSGPLTAMTVSAMLLLGSTSGADADYRGYAHSHGGGGLLGGAIVGGAIGGVVGGKKGIIPGAIIGGAVGAATSSAARPAPPPPPRAYYPPAPAYDSGLVYNIQNSLTLLGYNPGPIDGVYGQRTADAISAYEYNNQLPVTGQPSPGVHYHMKQAGG
jgi:hypothetical protein